MSQKLESGPLNEFWLAIKKGPERALLAYALATRMLDYLQLAGRYFESIKMETLPATGAAVQVHTTWPLPCKVPAN